MLDSSRQQLSRVSSRLTQTAGLTRLDLAAEVVAFAYGAIGAAIEVALREATEDVLQQLRAPAPHALTPVQFAAVAESTFTAFAAGEKARGRFAVRKAIDLRSAVVQAVRAATHPPPAPSVITMTGVPTPDHFHLFFEIATAGIDPRGIGAQPPLPRLIARINDIRGPRNDFAHDCADPTEHQLVVGRSQDMTGLRQMVAHLRSVIADLETLVDVIELACDFLKNSQVGQAPARSVSRPRRWQNPVRLLWPKRP